MLKSFFVERGNRLAAVVARAPLEVVGEGDDVGVGGEVDIRLFGVGF